MRTLAFASTIALLGLTSTAEAHFLLMSPLPSNPADQVGAPTSDNPSGKGSPPCGPDTVAAATPTPAQGGHPLMLKLQETVPHDGFYRVALALNSRTDLPVDNVVYDSKGTVLPPTGKPGGTSARADSEATPVFPVLADDLFPHPTATYKTVADAVYMSNIMLPNVNCDRCILQVIEYMNGHGFNSSVPGPGGGYFYHHCAELKITADPNLPLYSGGTDGGVSPDASSGTAGASGTGGATGTAGSGSAGAGEAGASGTAGTTNTGVAGSSGSAGSTSGAAGTSSGTAGATAGTAGTSGSAGTSGHGSSGGGCNVGGSAAGSGASLSALALVTSVLVKRRRRLRR
jgi:hypothetical protein